MKITDYVSIFLFSILLIALGSINFSADFAALAYGEISNRQEVLEAERLKSIADQRLAMIESNPKNILFVGDVLLARNVESLMKKSGADYPYRGVNFNSLAPKYYLFANFEATIPVEHKQTKVNKINFSVAKDFIPALRGAGFSHLSLANNHSYDYGEVAVTNTIRLLKEDNLAPFGNFKNLNDDSVSYVSIADFKVSVIGIHALQSKFSDEDLVSVLDKAGANSDFQIIFVHWGTEYSEHSDKEQRALAKRLVDFGADLIIGHHPHVVQEIGLIEGVPVFYSLGNYIFDQYFSTAVQTGLLLNLDFSTGLNINLLPVTSLQQLSQPKLMTEEQKQMFLYKLAKNSAPELKNEILNGQIELNFLFASSSKMAIIDI